MWDHAEDDEEGSPFSTMKTTKTKEEQQANAGPPECNLC